MKKQESNILIKDSGGMLYRIFKIAYLEDRWNETYFKVMFPSLIGKIVTTSSTDKYIKPPDINIFLKSKPIFNSDDFHEFSYHYESGITHYKNSKNEYLYEKRGLPKLQEEKFLNFIRFIVHDLNGLDPYKKEVNKNDIVLKLHLNEFGRLLNLHLLYGVNVRIENDDAERVSLLDCHTIQINGAKTCVVISEYAYNRPELIDSRVSLGVFTFDNTHVGLIK